MLKPGRDTLLIGQQGTQVLVPATAWPAGTGSVKLQLREFYKITDMLLAGLHTRSGSQLLETGGMIHLAATAAGQPVSLRPDAALSLYFPTTKVKADMQLFRGVYPEDELTDVMSAPGLLAVSGVAPPAEVVRFDWRPDTATITRKFFINLRSFDTLAVSRAADRGKIPPNTQVITNVRRMPGSAVLPDDNAADYWPAYSASEQQLKELTQIKYDQASIGQALRAPESAQELAMVYAYNAYIKRPQSIKRLTEIEFTVDTLGNTSNARVRPGYNDELAEPVLALIKSWKGWKPARRLTPYGEEPAAALGVVRVLVTANGQARVSPITWDHDALDIGGILAAKTVARKKAGVPSTDDLAQELRSTGMGWINCDRFYNTGQPIFTFKLNTAQPNAQAMLVFRDMRSVLDGEANIKAQSVTFANVPVGTVATVVAIRWQQGRAYLALHPTTLSPQTQQPRLDYRPVTLPELRRALAALE